MTGVTLGFMYKMKFVYSHFPINVTMAGNVVEIRNFMGEKRVRQVTLPAGVEGVRSADVKDELCISGIDLVKVSMAGTVLPHFSSVPTNTSVCPLTNSPRPLHASILATLAASTAAQVSQMTNIRLKDLRKFLDGIYVTEKRNISDKEV